MKSDAPALNRVRELLASMEGCPVLVLGDLMLDVYLKGEVERISPESPVPVVEVTRRDLRLGGAANVARNIRALGGKPRLVALIGDDSDGGEIRGLLDAGDIAASDLVVDPGRCSTVKTRVMGSGQQICRYDSESRQPAKGAILDALRDGCLKILPQVKAVVLSDYGKGVLADSLVKELITEARKLSIPVVVDPKEGHFDAYRGADLVTPNKAEAGGSFGIPIRDDGDLEHVGRGLQKRLGGGAVMITIGRDGIALFQEGEPQRRFPAKARQVFDVTGAGDTVVSVLALVLATGGDLAEGASLANQAAGLVVGRIGTAAVEPSELLATYMDEILGQPRYGGNHGQVLDLGEATRWVARERAAGQTIVFTNGCFDILHFGHFAILGEAARQGDLLVVGINSDASVRRLKGESRPVNPLEERARLLAHLRSVDLVVPFDDDTPLELIRELRPEVLVKGDEYSEDAIVGAEDVRSWGGTIHRFPMQKGYSTTLTIKRKQNAENSG